PSAGTQRGVRARVGGLAVNETGSLARSPELLATVTSEEDAPVQVHLVVLVDGAEASRHRVSLGPRGSVLVRAPLDGVPPGAHDLAVLLAETGEMATLRATLTAPPTPAPPPGTTRPTDAPHAATAATPGPGLLLALAALAGAAATRRR
ncbi:MAG TPA: hypothetical protein VNX21_08180, partial [Candidatus Thermoplasmatota archaeon]|nr:hypothetical protein [Candidatus Thermoplasmatota archaeon]